jgi:hypothetical protein
VAASTEETEMTAFDDFPALRLRRQLLLMAAASLVLAGACSGDPATPDGADFLRAPSRDAAPFQTDALEYALLRNDIGYHMQIGVEYTNLTGVTSYFVNCNGATALALEKWIDDAWVAVWWPVLPECLSAPIEVRPGERWTTEVHVFGGLPGTDYYPQFDTQDLPGVYRLRWTQLLRTYDPDRYPFGELLALAHTVSNRFVVRLDD